MLDDNDKVTFLALSELVDLKAKAVRPIVFWIGAGASRWAHLPGWADLADAMRSQFRKYEAKFANQDAAVLCEKRCFPEFFGLCKQTSETRYNSILAAELRIPQKPRPVYERFINALKKSNPSGVLTTNVDELLEQNLMWPTVNSANLERVPAMLREQPGFVAKLHGSVSDMTSLVFTQSEYERVTADPSFQNVLRRVFQEAHVVFFGYGITDKHVLQMLNDVDKLSPIFGAGPHFACIPHELDGVGRSVKAIRYIPEPHKDHRSVIQVVEELLNIAPIEKTSHQLTPSSFEALQPVSAHFLAEVYPPGTWQSSQRCELATDDGPTPIIMYSGHGLTNEELPDTLSTAMHDVLVGLLCFDRIYASIKTVSRIVKLLGEQIAIDCISSGVVRFVRSDEEDILIFPEGEYRSSGRLDAGLMGLGKDGCRSSSSDLIRRQIQPNPGKKVAAEKFIEKLCEAVEAKMVDHPDLPEMNISRQVHSLLVRPSIRKMLGMSTATPGNSIPAWLKYPILRLAHVVRLGAQCRSLNVASAKVDYGSDLLATSAFGSSFVTEYAHQIASYVVAGGFSTDLGEYVNYHPEVLGHVLRFRDTKEGRDLRSNVLAHLNLAGGGEVATAINAGLAQFLPLKLLESARLGFSKLFVSSQKAMPAIWHDANLAGAVLSQWRKKAAVEFINHCKVMRIKAFELCPCGSGESAKNCCIAALDIKIQL
jgi:hypothetical protein